jgi:acetyl esterase/lipase
MHKQRYIVICALLSACGTDTGTSDNGSTPPVDAGNDGMDVLADAAPDQFGDEDSGERDAPVQPPEIPFGCADDLDGVYAAQATADDPLGAVVACQVDHQADANGVAGKLSEANVGGVEVKTGYRAYRIAYRTNRGPDTPGTGTARLYVPDMPGPRPVVVVTHGTAGLADHCAPSTTDPPTVSSNVLALPWVTSGFVTVLPDYAGLGNAGVQGYGNRLDTTYSAIDAGRAATSIPGTLPQLIIVGHSQGGGVALSTQALIRGYGDPDVELVAAVSIGGNLSEDNSLLAFRYPNFPVTGGDGVTLAVVLLAFYADWANLFGEARGGEILHPDIRDHAVAALGDQCIYPFVATINDGSPENYDVPGTVGEILDPSIREAVVSCDRAGECSADASAYVERRRANDSPPDPDGAPVLMLSGGADVQSPLSRQACTRDYLQAAGVEVSTCGFPGEDHFSIPEASIVHGLGWVEAILAAEPEPDCPAPEEPYPECPD